MIGVRYEATDSGSRDVTFRVLANGHRLGTVSLARFALGWRAVAESGTVLPGLFRKRGDAGDALVEWSGILDR